MHYANAGAYPTSFNDMIKSDPAELTLPSDAKVSDDGLQVSANGWTLTLTPNGKGTAQPTFSCS